MLAAAGLERRREQAARREHPRPDDHRARAVQDPAGGDLVVHEGDRRQGQLRRHRLGCDALQARRREHRAHLHRRRRRVRLVVHGPVRRRQVGRAARRPSAEAAAEPTSRAPTPPSRPAARRTRPASRTTSASRSTTRSCSPRPASRRSRRRSPSSAQAADKLKAAGVQVPALDPDGRDRGRRHAVVPADARERRPALRHNFKPTFQKPGSAGYKALQWEAMAVKKGWVSPGAVSLDDAAAFDKFTAGQTAMVLATGPGNLVTANDPRASRASPGQAAAALVPGRERAAARRSASPRGSRSRSRPSTRPPRPRSSSGGRSRRTRSRSTRRRATCRAAASVIKQLAASGQLAGGNGAGAGAEARQAALPAGRAASGTRSSARTPRACSTRRSRAR